MTKSRINSEKLIEKQLVQKYNYKKRKEYEQKKHIMSFRCNDEIYEKIKSESQRLNISSGEYISKCIEGCNIINIDDKYNIAKMFCDIKNKLMDLEIRCNYGKTISDINKEHIDSCKKAMRNIIVIGGNKIKVIKPNDDILGGNKNGII